MAFLRLLRLACSLSRVARRWHSSPQYTACGVVAVKVRPHTGQMHCVVKFSLDDLEEQDRLQYCWPIRPRFFDSNSLPQYLHIMPGSFPHKIGAPFPMPLKVVFLIVVFISRFHIVVMFTKRLPVLLIPEQFSIPAMGNDVVHHGGLGKSTFSFTDYAEGMGL